MKGKCAKCGKWGDTTMPCSCDWGIVQRNFNREDDVVSRIVALLQRIEAHLDAIKYSLQRMEARK